MSLKNVRSVARDAGIGLDGVRIKIIRDPNLVGTGFAGHTPNARTIHLYPDAFTSRQELRATLGHERTHIYQHRTFGAPTETEQLARFEDGAYAVDYQW